MSISCLSNYAQIGQIIQMADQAKFYITLKLATLLLSRESHGTTQYDFRHAVHDNDNITIQRFCRHEFTINHFCGVILSWSFFFYSLLSP